MGSRYELIDVDDEEGFEFAEKLWKANLQESGEGLKVDFSRSNIETNMTWLELATATSGGK